MPGASAMADGHAAVPVATRLRLVCGVCLSTFLLCIARLLVVGVRPAWWAAAIGKRVAPGAVLAQPLPIADQDAGAATERPGPEWRQVALTARLVERAATKLPGITKCLPRAIVVQWLLRSKGIDSILVIAVHANDRSKEHGFHAWVEHRGDIVIGECDRTEYRPIMAYAQGVGATRA